MEAFKNGCEKLIASYRSGPKVVGFWYLDGLLSKLTISWIGKMIIYYVSRFSSKFHHLFGQTQMKMGFKDPVIASSHFQTGGSGSVVTQMHFKRLKRNACGWWHLLQSSHILVAFLAGEPVRVCIHGISRRLSSRLLAECHTRRSRSLEHSWQLQPLTWRTSSANLFIYF